MSNETVRLYEAQPLLSSGQPLGIGIGCILAGAMLVALGSNLIRRAARRERHHSAHRQRSYCLQPGWCLGSAVLGLGHLGTFIAFFFASAWLVSLLGLTALLWNLILARLINSEPIGRKRL